MRTGVARGRFVCHQIGKFVSIVLEGLSPDSVWKDHRDCPTNQSLLNGAAIRTTGNCILGQLF
ncbi:MAG: hypothetical protein M0P14_06185 [Alkaliphilus sp.]|nr:hypothetical protein [Alkaliphilus sp.]